MKPIFHHSLLAACIAAALPFSVAAAEPVRQPQVLVTATRHAQSADEALASVTVLTRADIEASQAPDLISLLSRQAGVDIARTGGPGSASTLFLRGTNANHTLVLVDGIRVNSTGQGVFDFAHLPLDQIERIELVRGPRAALWGSDAIGGVLHIFTRDPAAASVRLRGGRYGRAEGSAALGRRGERGGFGLTAGYGRLRGFSATNEDSFSFDPDDDGYRNRSLSLRGDTALGHQRLGFHALATDADVEFDRGETAARNASGGLTLGGALGTHWSHLLSLGHAREDLDTPAFGSRFESRRHNADWVHHFAVGPGALNAGLNWQHESGLSLSQFSGVVIDRVRTTRAGFLGYAGRAGAQDFEAALRHDHNSQFGGATTGNAAWGWRFTDDLRVRLAWGQGFRAPNFNELYHPGFGGGLFAGNPALRPERSRSIEAGLDWTPGDSQRLGLSAYRSRVRDLISFSGANFQAINIARAEIDGAELEYGLLRGGWQFDGSLTWQDPVNAITGQRLLRRAARKANASLGYRFDGGIELALDGQFVSDREDVGGRLSGYGLAHLRLGWELAPAWRLEARIENLFDRDYTVVRGYNTPGRNLMVTLGWHPAQR